VALTRRDIEITLNQGLSVKQSDAFQDASSATQVDNLHFDQAGELVKRPGIASAATIEVPTGSDYPNGQVQSLFTRGNEVIGLTADNGLVVIDGNDPTDYNYTHREASVLWNPDTIPKYAPRASKVSRFLVDRAQAGSASVGIMCATSAVYDGVLISAWAEYGVSVATIKMKAVDLETGQVIATTQYDTQATPYVWTMQAIPVNEAGAEGVLIGALVGASAPFSILAYQYVAATRTFMDASAGGLTGQAKYPIFALAPSYSGSEFYLGFTDNTTGFVQVHRRTLTALVSTHLGTTSAENGIAIVAGASRVLIVSAVSATVRAEVYGTPADIITAFTGASGEVFYGCSLALSDTSEAIAYINLNKLASPGYSKVAVNSIDFTATTPVMGSTESTIPHAWAAGSPVTYDGRVYVPVAIDAANTLTSVILCRYSQYTSNSQTKVSHEPVARIMHDRYYSSYFGLTANTTSIVGNKIHLTLTGDAPTSSTSGIGLLAQSLFHSTVELAESDAAMPLPYVDRGGVTTVASGLLFDWDGETPSEHQPLRAPKVVIDAASGTGTTVTQLSMVALYKGVDGQGNLHRSAPSAVKQSGAVANKQIDVYVAKLPFTAYEHRGPLAVPELYITEDEGSTYYLASSGGYTCQPTSFNTKYWVFENVDAGSPSFPQLYSTGAGGQERPASPPPSFRDLAQVQDRLVGIDAEDPSRIWFTKPLVPGYAPEWSNLQTLTIGAEGMAVRELGGIMCVLAKDSIWAVDGSGPDALGNGAFGLPRLAARMGCIDTTSVCSTPAGVFFRSQRGFQLVDGGFGVTPIGLPIEPETRLDSLRDYEPGRAIYDELSQEVRFLDSENSCQWVFHLGEQKWARYPDDVPLDIVATSEGVWILDEDNQVCAEIPLTASSTSEGSWTYRTPYLTLNGLVGFGAVFELVLQLRVRENVTRASLAVTYETRGPLAGTESLGPWPGSELATLGDDIIEVRMQPEHQKCKAFRLTITETCTGQYAGSSPLALRLIYGADKSVKATRTYALKGST